MIDPTFRYISRLFAFSFKNGKSDRTRNYLDKYYMPLLEFKDFNVLIANISFFGQTVKSKQDAYEKLIKKSKKNLYHRKYYKLIGI